MLFALTVCRVGFQTNAATFLEMGRRAVSTDSLPPGKMVKSSSRLRGGFFWLRLAAPRTVQPGFINVEQSFQIIPGALKGRRSEVSLKSVQAFVERYVINTVARLAL
jgi:hypothetical protein